MKHKVLQVVTQLEPAGAQTVASWLASSLRSQFSVRTVFFYKKSDFEPFTDSDCLVKRRGKNPLVLLKIVSNLRRLMKSEADTVIAHTHYSIMIVLATSLLLFQPPRIIATHHWPEGRYPMVVRWSDAVLRFLSRSDISDVYVSESITRRGSDVVIRNPVVRREIRQPTGGASLFSSCSIDILVVARHSREKSIETIISAMDRLSHRRLVLVGSGPDTDKLKEIASSNDRIEFAGRLSNDEVRALMRRCEVLVLPSLWEAMPMVLLEGVAEGCRLVVSDIGAHKTLIDVGAAVGFEVGSDQDLVKAIEKVAALGLDESLSAGREKMLALHDEQVVLESWRAVLSTDKSVLDINTSVK